MQSEENFVGNGYSRYWDKTVFIIKEPNPQLLFTLKNY